MFQYIIFFSCIFFVTAKAAQTKIVLEKPPGLVGGTSNQHIHSSVVRSRGGVEDTRLEAKAKDSKNFEAKAKDRPSRGQGPRTQTQVFSKKKKVFKIFFSGDLYLRKPKKGLCRFSARFLAFSNDQRNFNGSKIVLSSSRGQGKFRGLEASRPRTSKCVPIEDSTFGAKWL